MRNRERGAVSLELALVVPIFLLLLAATATIGHALVVRYRISDAAMVASRSGVTSGRLDGATAQSIVQSRLGSSVNVCAPLRVTTQTANFLGGARAFQVTVSCVFTGGVAQGFLRSLGIVQPPLTVNAATPF